MLEKIRQHFASPINKKAASITALVLIVLAIPLTVFISQQQQEIRQRAQEISSAPTPFPPLGTVFIHFAPSSQSVNLGSTLPVALVFDAGSVNNITGVDIAIRYNKDVLEVSSFEPSTTFNNQLVNNFDNQAGTLRYAAANTTSSANGTVNIGVINFRAKAEGTSTVAFNNIQVTALGQSGSLTVPTDITGSYTVVAPTPTSAPIATSTPEPIASCSTLYNRIVRAMGKSCGVEAYDNVADLNRDRRVSNTDYSLYLVDSGNGTRAEVCDNYLSSTVNPCAATPSASPTPVVGDANGDGNVDILDFNIWRDEFLGRAQTKRADFNRDDRVDLLDFAIWRNAIGGTSPSPTTAPTAPPNPTPTPTPIQQAYKGVFVTSANYNGNLASYNVNLGGLASADTSCQNLANTRGLGGIWKAWLSDRDTNVISRLTHASVPYQRLDGVVVANNWADLTDGALQNPINKTETGATKNGAVWTGGRFIDSNPLTYQNGAEYDCNRWTAATAPGAPTYSGNVGISDITHSWWAGSASWSCTSDSSASLYCFEQ